MYFHGSCYRVFNTNLNWVEAKAACERLGSTLATVKSQAEGQALSPIVSEAVWIGLYRDNDTTPWEWVDGTQAEYVNWYIYEPSHQGKNQELCVMMFSAKKAMKWNNGQCTGHEPLYVCEVSGR